jgi:hypothetical protein
VKKFLKSGVDNSSTLLSSIAKTLVAKFLAQIEYSIKRIASKTVISRYTDGGICCLSETSTSKNSLPKKSLTYNLLY